MKSKLLASVAVLALFALACEPQILSRDKAVEALAKMSVRVKATEDYPTGSVRSVTKISSLTQTLPPVDQFELTVNPPFASSALVLEVFSSTEKSGSGTDGWLKEATEAFNDKNYALSDGTRVKIKVRNIASGTAYEYIASKTYTPQLFTPSNMLWVKMTEAAGVKVQVLTERVAGNTAGIVMKNQVYKDFEKQYGSVDFRKIVDAVIRGEISMGYTNPFASSTGLNFLQTVLSEFAKGDESRMLSPEAVSAFEAFQKGVPFVSLTTLQMRDSVENDGSLDAFVMEYQMYNNTKGFKQNYKFIPFGVRHDSPLCLVGDVDAREAEAGRIYADYLTSEAVQRTASDFGFNYLDEYKPAHESPSGEILTGAQVLWKEKKDSGAPVVAVFLCDVSGSMDGLRIKNLKKALIEGSSFISTGNYIGLVSFSDRVTKLLPVRQFDENQHASFVSAVGNLSAAGRTAMYDGIVVSLDMLVKETSKVPGSKPMLFVLTDGETNSGYSYSRTYGALAGSAIPIYTISYGESVDVLKELSSINEAASLSADETDISYKIGALLNAEM
jgi:Ca-activated chloride channel family protein